MKRMGSVEKAFHILQLLADEPQQAHALGRIAGALDLNKATCAHILRRLTDLNYAEQLGPRKGYRLGPMVYALSRKGPYRRDLVAAAKPMMDRLVERVREAVLLVTLRGATRFTLCHIQSDRAVRVDESVSADTNVYATATGRLLLAHAGRYDLGVVVERTGLPDDEWPEVASMSDLSAALEAIRRAAGSLVVVRDEVVAVASPIYEEGAVVAALGLYLPTFRFEGEHKSNVLSGVKEAADRITEALGAVAVQGAV